MKSNDKMNGKTCRGTMEHVRLDKRSDELR